LALQTVCWSTAGSQIFGVHHTAAGLPRWCILGCSAISLDSIHWMSVAVTPHTHTFNNQDHLRTLSRVLLAGAKSPSVKNPLLRADGVAQVVDCPPSMQEALSSNATTAKKKTKKKNHHSTLNKWSKVTLPLQEKSVTACQGSGGPLSTHGTVSKCRLQPTNPCSCSLQWGAGWGAHSPPRQSCASFMRPAEALRCKNACFTVCAILG
jgi:hypothetical protein